MLCKIIFRVGLCVVLLAIASCSAPETITSKETAEVSRVETAEAKSEEAESRASEVIISLGDKKLTMQQVKWVLPGADNQRTAKFANWWLENELLYAEAEKRGVTKEPKAKFIAELMKKKAFSQELVLRVKDAVKISDEKVRDYYETNKDTDFRLKQPGYLNFSHIRTKTLEEAQTVLERIKAGEDINKLAKELSIYGDAEKGGAAKKYVYRTIKRRFGNKFFEAIVAVEKGELIGPIKVGDNAYEVARQEGKIEPKPLPFEKVKEQIRVKLPRIESGKVFGSLVDSLKEEAANKIVKSPLITQTEKPVGDKFKEGNEK